MEMTSSESISTFWEDVGYLALSRLKQVTKRFKDAELVILIPKEYERDDLVYFFGVPIKYVDISTPYIGLRV